MSVTWKIVRPDPSNVDHAHRRTGFDTNVTAIWLPLDSSGQFVLHINQTDWRETNSTVSSYRSFQRLSQVLDPARLRWRVDVAGAIRAIDDYTVLYKARVQIQIQTKRRNDDDWTRTQTFDDAISVAEFGQILFDQVFNAYVAFFQSRYQMKIVNLGV